MRIREEWVTVELARHLRADGWRIVSVHPPGGQGPFVIPREAMHRDIERSSFHPDVVAIRRRGGVSRVLIAETKPDRAALSSDVDKLQQLASSRDALLFVLFRCQTFSGGPEDGVDFDHYQSTLSEVLPIDFVIACAGDRRASSTSDALGPYALTEEVFAAEELIRKYSKATHE